MNNVIRRVLRQAAQYYVKKEAIAQAAGVTPAHLRRLALDQTPVKPAYQFVFMGIEETLHQMVQDPEYDVTTKDAVSHREVVARNTERFLQLWASRVADNP